MYFREEVMPGGQRVFIFNLYGTYSLIYMTSCDPRTPYFQQCQEK